MCLKSFVLLRILSQGSCFKPDPGIQDVTQTTAITPVNQLSDSAVGMYLHRAIKRRALCLLSHQRTAHLQASNTIQSRESRHLLVLGRHSRKKSTMLAVRGATMT